MSIWHEHDHFSGKEEVHAAYPFGHPGRSSFIGSFVQAHHAAAGEGGFVLSSVPDLFLDRVFSAVGRGTVATGRIETVSIAGGPVRWDHPVGDPSGRVYLDKLVFSSPDGDLTVGFSQVPEPSMALLVGLGLIGLVTRRSSPRSRSRRVVCPITTVMRGTSGSGNPVMLGQQGRPRWMVREGASGFESDRSVLSCWSLCGEKAPVRRSGWDWTAFAGSF